MTLIQWLIYWVKLAGQMLGQNCRSKSLVEFVGQIHKSNPLVKLLVEIMDQIPGSNLWVKLGGQISALAVP